MSKKVNSLIFALVLFVLTFTNVFAAPEFQTSANKDQKIKTLQDQGYLHGYVDGSLKLEDKIKRSEFATVIVYALEKQDLAKELQGKSEPFTDVKKDYWANGIISVIKDGKGLSNVNIIAGYPDGTFKPENKISNAEAIKMLVCLKKSDLTKEMIDNAKWPTSWIAWAREEGIIGKNSNISEDLDFSAEALRGDVFTMFYNSFMESDKKTSENVKSPIKSIPVINVRDTRRGYRESRSYNPPFKYEEGRPWTPLTPAEPHIPLTPLKPAEPHIPLTPLEPAEPYIPLTPLEPAEPYIPLTPLTPAEPVEEVKEYTLTAGEEIEVLTSAKDNGKYNEGTEISFTVKDLPGKTAKVEKIVDGNAEDLTKDADGKYSFNITADTTIKVIYEDIDYTLTVEDPENGVTNLTEAKDNGKYNEGIEISFAVEKAGKLVKVEKVVDGNAEELTATDGKYSFTIESDTTIKVTYENIYTLTTGEGIENLTEANADDKYKENTEISFTVEEKAGKTVKVEKVVNGKAEELKATDGEYKFTIEADTTIKVTYADIKYTVTTEAEEGAIQGLENGSKHNVGTDLSFTVKEEAGKTVKVEKVVNGKAEELKATEGKYNFTITADTTIKVTYEGIQYTVTTEAEESLK